jgi:hypothetical protein
LLRTQQFTAAFQPLTPVIAVVRTFAWSTV